MAGMIRKEFLRGGLIGVLCAAIIGLILPRAIPEAELLLLDMRFKARGEVRPSSSIVLVAIDDRSIEEIGRWPWRRAQHKAIIDALHYFGAKAAVFDIFFVSPDDLFPEDDYLLTEAMRNAGNVLLISRFKGGSETPKEDREFVEKAKEILSRNISASAIDIVEGIYPGIFRTNPYLAETYREEVEGIRSRMAVERFSIPVPEEARGMFPKASDLIPPCYIYSSSAKGVGFATVMPDPDGVVRRQPLFVEHNGRLYPHVALLAACFALGGSPSSMRIRRGSVEIEGRNGRVRIPIDRRGRIVVNWVGPRIDSFRTIPYSVLGISYVDVVNGRTPIAPLEDLYALKGGLCFIGLTATGTMDLNPTPFSPRYPMVGLHLSIANSIITRSFILESPLWLDISVLLFLSVLVSVISLGLSARIGIFVSIGVMALYVGLSFLLFISWNIWVDTALPLGAMALSYGSSVSYKFVEEQRARRRIRSMFERYLPPEVVRSLVSRKEEIRLGGERIRLTVLFSDIRNFTTMSEGMKPEEVVEVLNEYLTAMTEIIFRNGGMVDKFIGDAIMAIFGAPILDPESREHHALRAAKTALEMVAKLEELKEEWKAKGYPTFDIGVGINTGDMVIGNVGSPRRMDYTVIGDSVNTASRLEGLNKQFGTRIIIGEETYEEIKDRARVRFLGNVQVKGKAEEVGIYELLGMDEKGG
jgi:adenylate cyclase